MSDLPPSAFFDVPPVGIRARSKTALNLSNEDVLLAVERYSSPKRERERDGSERSGDAVSLSLSLGLSNTPYRAAAPLQQVNLTLRPASVELRVCPSRPPGFVLGHTLLSKHPPPKRGRVREFSEKSRLGLQRLAADLQAVVQKPDIMVTLTYPADWHSVCTDCTCGANQGSSDVSSCICSPSGSVSKAHLKAFRKRLTRYLDRFGITGWGCLWFLEFQTRGAPHFHLLLFGLSGPRTTFPLNLFKKWCSRVWSDIVGHRDPIERQKHLKAGTRSERCRAAHFGYALKYAAKLKQKLVPPEFSDIGRFWGCWNSPLDAPVLRSFYAAPHTLKRISETLFANLYKHSKNFAMRVYNTLQTADEYSCFTLTIFGADSANYLRSYGLPKFEI